MPKIEFSQSLGNENSFVTKNCGVTNGVTVAIIPTSIGIVVNLNINKKMNWYITFVKFKGIGSNDANELGNGICIVLYKNLNKGIKLSLLELIAHNSGKISHLIPPCILVLKKKMLGWIEHT